MCAVFRRSTREISPTVSSRPSENYVRKLGPADLKLVLEAQESCSYDLDAPMSAIAISDGLRRKELQGLVLEREGCTALICYQIEGNQALLTCGYRKGRSEGLLRDCKFLLERLEGILREWGVERVALYVGQHNPNFLRIYDLLKRLGFASDMMRMGKRF